MRQISLLISAMVISTLSFAHSSGNQANFGSKLGSTWKSHQSSQPQNTRNDITIVYGGEDVANRSHLALHTTTV